MYDPCIQYLQSKCNFVDIEVSKLYIGAIMCKYYITTLTIPCKFVAKISIFLSISLMMAMAIWL